MNIERCGRAIDAQDGGVSYKLKVDGEIVACHVSMEALQDIDPSQNQGNAMAQFEAYEDRLLSIAEEKIRKGDYEDNVVKVYTADI